MNTNKIFIITIAISFALVAAMPAIAQVGVSVGQTKVGVGGGAVLEEQLLKGAASHGWPDERWTLSRVRALIAHTLGVDLSVPGVWGLLRRHGWSCQQPARRAIERNEAAVAGWIKETWPSAKQPPRRSGPGSSSRTKPPSR